MLKIIFAASFMHIFFKQLEIKSYACQTCQKSNKKIRIWSIFKKSLYLIKNKKN